MTEAIETPNDRDDNPMTSKIHVRKDEKGNYYLMVPKDSDVSEEELNRVAEFYRDIKCPEIIPDYNSQSHGEQSEYHQAMIRKNKMNFFDKCLLLITGPPMFFYD